MTKAVKIELTLSGDCKKGICFTIEDIYFHLTKDVEFNSNRISDIYHIWCLCEYFDGVEAPMGHVYVDWLCGASFIEEVHKAFLDGEISKQEFEQYLGNAVNMCCSNWLKKNRELINHE